MKFVPFSDVLLITMAVLRTSTEQTPRDVAERPSDPVFWILEEKYLTSSVFR